MRKHPESSDLVKSVSNVRGDGEGGGDGDDGDIDVDCYLLPL